MKSITNSEYKLVNSCKQRWAYAYHYKRVPCYDFAQPLFEGGLLDAGVECFWQGKSLDEAVNHITLLANRCKEHKRDIYFARVNAMLHGYYAMWKNDLEIYDVLHTQTVFQSINVNGRIFYTKPDVVLRDKSTNQIILQELKTCKFDTDIEDPASDYFISLNINTQLIAYLVSLEVEYPDTEILIRYDVVRKPKDSTLKNIINPKTEKPWVIRRRKDETDEELKIREDEVAENQQQFQNRLIETWVENKLDYYRQRYIEISQNAKKSWANDVRITTMQMDMCIEQEIFPKSDVNCKSFGRMCEYHKVCCELDSIDSPNFKDKEYKHIELKID